MVSFIPHDMMYGPQAALIAECFTPAAALQRRLARLSSVVGNRRRTGAADRDGAARLDRLGLFGGGLHHVCAIVSIIATAFLPDYTNRDISQEASYGAAEPEVAEPVRARNLSEDLGVVPYVRGFGGTERDDRACRA